VEKGGNEDRDGVRRWLEGESDSGGGAVFLLRCSPMIANCRARIANCMMMMKMIVYGERAV
jgi:hypothetical protein